MTVRGAMIDEDVSYNVVIIDVVLLIRELSRVSSRMSGRRRHEGRSGGVRRSTQSYVYETEGGYPAFIYTGRIVRAVDMQRYERSG